MYHRGLTILVILNVAFYRSMTPALLTSTTGKDGIYKQLQEDMQVPRVVHYTFFYSKTNATFRFHMLLSLLSAYQNIRPTTILFWYDSIPQGHWWEEAKRMVPIIKMVYRKAPTSIFGNTIEVAQHQSDIVRLEAVMRYGGIYMDLDVIALKSFDPFLAFDTTMGLEEPGRLCNALIISRPNASFLNSWYDRYKSFNDTEYSEHSVALPARLACSYPELIHVEETTFHRPNYKELIWIHGHLSYNWQENYAMKLWYRKYDIDHTPESIKRLNTTMGQIFRYVYYGILPSE